MASHIANGNALFVDEQGKECKLSKVATNEMAPDWVAAIKAAFWLTSFIRRKRLGNGLRPEKIFLGHVRPGGAYGRFRIWMLARYARRGGVDAKWNEKKRVP